MTHHPPTRRARRAPLSRRASIYILVLGCAMIVFVVGVSTIALAHSSSRAAVAANDGGRAALLARSALETVVAWMNQNPNWRTAVASGTGFTFNLDGAAVQAMIVDEADGNLANNPNEPVRVYACSGVGASRRILSAVAVPTSTAGLDVLRCAVHSNTTITISGGNLILQSSPLSTNFNLSNGGSISGNVEVGGSYTSTGRCYGLVTCPAPVKTMPSAAGVQALFSDATTVSLASLPVLGGQLDGKLVSSTSSPFGAPNAAGKYVINVAPLSTFTIKRSRLAASLLVNVPFGSKLLIEDSVCWEPADASLPALVVAGSGSFHVSSLGTALSEAVVNMNFNPIGTSYNAVTDNDKSDTYPAQITGVVHVLNSAVTSTIDKSSRFFGCLISAGPIVFQNNPTATADPSYLSNPPRGYANTTGGTMRILAGTFRSEVADDEEIKVAMIDSVPPPFGAQPVGVTEPVEDPGAGGPVVIEEGGPVVN